MAETDSQPSPAAVPAPAPVSATSALMPRIALGLAVLALGSSALLWQQLQATRKELARRSTDSATAAT